MSKINILFNDKNYAIDESSFSSAFDTLKSHLSTAMNGPGAVINFGGTSYNVDSTKLSNATNDFITHLGTIAGNGSKVSVNGVEYSVDSTKVVDAVTELGVILGDLESEGSDSDSGVAIMEERVLVFSNEDTLNYAYQEVAPSFSLEANIKYTIYWDGVPYTCVAKVIDDAIAVGNVFIESGEPVYNTGEPFLIIYLPEILFGIATLDTTTNTHTVSIYPASDESSVTILPSTTLPFQEETDSLGNVIYKFVASDSNVDLIKGKQYTVVFDGIAYKCTVHSFEFTVEGVTTEFLYGGNGDILEIAFVGFDLVSSSAPFVFGQMGDTVGIYTTLTDPYHTVEIYQPAKEGEKIESINEYGFYYNTKYSCCNSDDTETSLYFRENQTGDIFINGILVQTLPVTYEKNIITVPNYGDINVLSEGKKLNASFSGEFKLGDSIIIENDYIYKWIYLNDILGWHAEVVDKTKSTYGTLKGEIDGYPVMLDRTFIDCENLITAPDIPFGVITLHGTFWNCINLTGNIVIDANPINCYECFAGTTKPITIIGSCSIETKAALASTTTNGNVTY